MNSSYLRFVLMSLLLFAVQVWVLSPVELFRVATPFVYPFVLMLLPLGANRSLLPILGFAIGGAIDVLGLTPGIHAAAMTLAAFVRYPLLQALTDRETPPSALPLYGTLRSRAIILMSLLLLIHHLALYFLVGATLHRDPYVLVSFTAGYGLSWLIGLILLFFFGTEPPHRS